MLDEVLSLDAGVRLNEGPEIQAVARRVIAAREQGRPVILIFRGAGRSLVMILEAVLHLNAFLNKRPPEFEGR